MIKKILATLAALVAATAFAATDVNKATKAELEAIKGIGPTYSTLIMSERKKSSFRDWNDLIDRVKGVGDTSARMFSEGGLTVNGATYVATREPSAVSKATSATKGAVEKTASATKAVASRAASATRAGATMVKENAKDEVQASKDNIREAKEKRAEKKAARADAASAPKK